MLSMIILMNFIHIFFRSVSHQFLHEHELLHECSTDESNKPVKAVKKAPLIVRKLKPEKVPVVKHSPKSASSAKSTPRRAKILILPENAKKWYRCRECKFRGRSRRYLTAHQRRKHLTTDRKPGTLHYCTFEYQVWGYGNVQNVIMLKNWVWVYFDLNCY